MCLKEALGPSYQLRKKGETLILSSLEAPILQASFNFIEKANRHILNLLDGIAAIPEWGHDIMIIFDDEHTYYQYISRYYPSSGEYAYSGGVFINEGCGHFVTVKHDLSIMEPIIAHELTHSALSHLSLPIWLDEGITVNVEHRISPSSKQTLSPKEMHNKHLNFWGTNEIQEFWSGKSFLRTDEGSILSYDLARILVLHFAKDWEKFRDFVLSVNVEDAGSAAAKEYMGIELGLAVTSLFDQPENPDWEPNPNNW